MLGEDRQGSHPMARHLACSKPQDLYLISAAPSCADGVTWSRLHSQESRSGPAPLASKP